MQAIEIAYQPVQILAKYPDTIFSQFPAKGTLKPRLAHQKIEILFRQQNFHGKVRCGREILQELRGNLRQVALPEQPRQDGQ